MEDDTKTKSSSLGYESEIYETFPAEQYLKRYIDPITNPQGTHTGNNTNYYEQKFIRDGHT